MKILSIHPGSDTAGQSMAAKPVLEAAGDEMRVFVGSLHPFKYPEAPVSFRKIGSRLEIKEEVRDAYRWADVVIINNDPELHERIANGKRKPEIIVYHHGSRFRNQPARRWAAAEAIGARQLVSTVDLLQHVPAGKEAWWHGQLVDVAKMQAIRAASERIGDRLRVSHAPTNRAIKGTHHIRKAMRVLAADFVLIQHQTWDRCLAMKASTDIFVDQLHLGYGNNAIEAWAMGLPVIAGADPLTLALMRQVYRGRIPFYEATPATVATAIRDLLADPGLRAEWAEHGWQHVQTFHAPEPWLERAHRLYAGDVMPIGNVA